MRQKTPAMPQVPKTMPKASKSASKATAASTSIETPLSASNFQQYRSLQRGSHGHAHQSTAAAATQAWQETQSTFRPNHAAQFRSLQRGASAAQPGQFRSAKVQDQRGVTADSMYSNNENERHLYAVTEL